LLLCVPFLSLFYVRSLNRSSDSKIMSSALETIQSASSLILPLARLVFEYYHQSADIFSTSRAFALILPDGSVVTWGNAGSGGDSSRVQAELKQGVDTIYSAYGAFAAKMQDGSVVTWGAARKGGDSSRVQAELKQGVDTIYSTFGGAFAAKMQDGSVVTWGRAGYGGDSSRVQAELKTKNL
jgi:co-chaperonin GroES (HSP10)